MIPSWEYNKSMACWRRFTWRSRTCERNKGAWRSSAGYRYLHIWWITPLCSTWGTNMGNACGGVPGLGGVSGYDDPMIWGPSWCTSQIFPWDRRPIVRLDRKMVWPDFKRMGSPVYSCLGTNSHCMVLRCGATSTHPPLGNTKGWNCRHIWFNRGHKGAWRSSAGYRYLHI